MKSFKTGAQRLNGSRIALTNSLIGFMILFIGVLFTSCKKEELKPAVTSDASVSGSNPLNKYSGLSDETVWELQQARAASARYLNIENAKKDGYIDISVDVEHMGHHYMKMTNVDLNFDYRKPEILVYNGSEGNEQLVAVEYAVPIELTPSVAPEGFSGSTDVWDRNTGFGLYLLHAWVWAYNPNGVFNPTNPNVHLD
jgi:hypothetical protein